MCVWHVPRSQFLEFLLHLLRLFAVVIDAALILGDELILLREPAHDVVFHHSQLRRRLVHGTNHNQRVVTRGESLSTPTCPVRRGLEQTANLLREDLDDGERGQEVIPVDVVEHLADLVLTVVVAEGKVGQGLDPQVRIHRPFVPWERRR